MAPAAQAMRIARDFEGKMQRWTFTMAIMASVIAQPARGQVAQPAIRLEPGG